MKRVQRAFALLSILLFYALWVLPARSQEQRRASGPEQGDSKNTKQPTEPKKSDAAPQHAAPTPTASATPPANPSTPEKTTPKAKEKTVWVNTTTGVYHKKGSRWYGKTKRGKYMTEADAIRAGFKAAETE